MKIKKKIRILQSEFFLIFFTSDNRSKEQKKKIWWVWEEHMKVGGKSSKLVQLQSSPFSLGHMKVLEARQQTKRIVTWEWRRHNITHKWGWWLVREGAKTRQGKVIYLSRKSFSFVFFGLGYVNNFFN
jgi:hypothetical protein